MKITEAVDRAVRATVEVLGFELDEVEYQKEHGNWVLTLYIDAPDGVSLDDCERVSRAVDPILDEADPVPDSYVFEVCSAGAERELKRPEDFMQFMGSQVEVKLYQPFNGSKAYVGVLAGYDKGNVAISAGGEEISFQKGQVAQVRLHISI